MSLKYEPSSESLYNSAPLPVVYSFNPQSWPHTFNPEIDTRNPKPKCVFVGTLNPNPEAFSCIGSTLNLSLKSSSQPPDPRIPYPKHPHP